MVSDIMKTNLFYITYRSNYAELKQLLDKSEHRSYPLVDAPGMCKRQDASMIYGHNMIDRWLQDDTLVKHWMDGHIVDS